MRAGIRFDPPRIEVTPEQAWVLARAFGPGGVPAPSPGDAARAVETAVQLGVAARIGARTPRAVADEVGGEGADRLAASYRAAAAASLARREMCRKLAGIAGQIGAPVIILKGAALELAGFAEAGSREAGDVDLLTLAERTDDLQRACVAAGFREVDIRPPEHEMRPLVHGSGLLVEVHRYLRGVRIGGERFATGGELVDGGLCAAGALGLEHVWLPDRDLLAAHALVHGVAQHGAAPESYPPFRVIGDIADLGLDETAWAAFADRGLAWIARDVSREEAHAVWNLGRRLGVGEDARDIAAESGSAGRMLRHALAAALDPGYARSLRILHIADSVEDSGRLGVLLRKVAINLWLRREEVDAIYGPQPSTARYLAMRLWRPWDLGRQVVASARERRRRSASRS